MNVLALLMVVILGLLFGSFLNVCISRLPAHDSIVTPRSRCPHCGTQIRAWDNIPVLSWIFLKRRCRDCQASIPIRYPFVEIALPSLWVLCFFKSGPVHESLQSAIFFAASATFCFFTLGLAVMDLETMRLPNSFTRPGTALAVLFAAVRLPEWMDATLPHPMFNLGTPPSDRLLPTHPHLAMHAMLLTGASALVGAGLILFIRWVYLVIRKQEGIGLGDAKLMAMIGAWQGPANALLVFFLAVLGAALYSIFMLTIRQKSGDRGLSLNDRIPLGFFLCAASFFSLFSSSSVIRWYMNFF
jgi:leader peptidase (prepilin peptidase) / N-methyltransferase